MKKKLPEEPYCSPITDEQRREILNRVKRGEGSAADRAILGGEKVRTISKLHATREQLAHPGDLAKALFAAPDQRQASVTATVEYLLPSAADWEVSTTGQAHKNEQRRKAQQPRSPVTRIIRELLRSHYGETASELWPRFLGFEERDLRIKDCGDYAEWSDKANRKEGDITFAAFKVALSRIRKKVT